MNEKKEGWGEDSTPILYESEESCSDKFYSVGVFDGMGGSGARVCKSDYDGEHTQAYVASRIVRDAVKKYLTSVLSYNSITPDKIKEVVKNRLQQEILKYPLHKSLLRSKSLMREYPTTLAITTACSLGENLFAVDSFGAGDSRNFLWNNDGFFQISKDDIVSNLDPMQNLRNDAPLSNCICANNDFYINHKRIVVSGKFLIISATDGCFGYYPTPMHFQGGLISELKRSIDWDNWKINLSNKMSEIAGDDTSFALYAIGFSGFDEFKDLFASSRIEGFEGIQSIQKEIRQIQDDVNLYSKVLDNRKKELEDAIEKGWHMYKVSYLKFVEDSNTEAESQRQIESDISTKKEESPDVSLGESEILML